MVWGGARVGIKSYPTATDIHALVKLTRDKSDLAYTARAEGPDSAIPYYEGVPKIKSRSRDADPL